MNRYELGFHPGGRGSSYIGLGNEREPLDQTDLGNGVDTTSKSVVN